MAKKRYFLLQSNETLPRHLKTTAYSIKIHSLIREYQEHQGNPPRHRVQDEEDYVRTIYLPGIEHEIAPEIEQYAERGRVKLALEKLKDPNNKLPNDIATKAAELYQTFESSAWKARRGSTPGDAITASAVLDHPIFAPGGIMHGMIPTRGKGGNRTFVPDPSIEWRRSDVYGHNDLEVGQWFARRGCAIIAGATNQPLRGISGHRDHGAYAVVVSGEYEDLDSDQGDVLYYSSEGAKGGDSQRQEDMIGNQALTASLHTGRPVRVLRGAKTSAKGRRSGWAPSCGLRYDGLYRVVTKMTKRGKHGGEFLQFKLERLQGQKDLRDVVRESPTAQQIEDFHRLEELKQLL